MDNSAAEVRTGVSAGAFRRELDTCKVRLMDNINGKTVAITGAARGIGHATAKALLQRGARVVIGDRDVNALESAVTALDASDRSRAIRWM